MNSNQIKELKCKFQSLSDKWSKKYVGLIIDDSCNLIETNGFRYRYLVFIDNKICIRTHISNTKEYATSSCIFDYNEDVIIKAIKLLPNLKQQLDQKLIENQEFLNCEKILNELINEGEIVFKKGDKFKSKKTDKILEILEINDFQVIYTVGSDTYRYTATHNIFKDTIKNYWTM